MTANLEISYVFIGYLNPVNPPTESKVKYWRINIWVYVQVIGEIHILSSRS